MYENGYYFTQSDTEAAEWYKKAASGGHAAAQVRLDALRLKSDWQGTLPGRLMQAL